MFDQNFDFWRTFQFLTKISIFDQKTSILENNFYFWPKTSILDNNFYIWPNFRFLTKSSFVDKHFDFPLFPKNIFFSTGWRCIKELSVGNEIEKICSNNNLIGIGTSKGVISLISQSTLKMTVRWKAYLPEQPITALQFKGNDYLFSSGHDPASDLIIWNISKHKTGKDAVF